MCHRQFFKILSRNPEFVTTQCKNFINAFYFGIRKWILENNS